MVKLLCVAVVVGFAAIVFVAQSQHSKEAASLDSVETSTAVVVSTQGAAIIGEGFEDGSDDTLRTLTATLKNRSEETAQFKTELKAELDSAQSELQSSLDQQKQTTSDLSTALALVTDQLTTLQERVKTGSASLKQKQSAAFDPDWEEECDPSLTALGLGECKKPETQDKNNTTSPSLTNHDYIWIDPLDARYGDDGKLILPDQTASPSTQWKESDDNHAPQETPLFSLHPGMVLSDAASMTALMGRVPMDGQVTDPYPFSMIVGADNLMANGVMLPEIQGAIVTGTVTGDWSLSCVRGVVETLSLILEDGRMVNYPGQESAAESNFDGSAIKTNDLGFLADPNGNPCLSGERITNAPQYLTTKGLLDAATAAANAVAVSQQTISVDGNTTTSSLTGSAAKNATAEAAAASSQTVSDFIQARMGMSFDIIYVPPGVKAAIHLRQPITLSLPETPSRVRYQTQQEGGYYALP
ncbi:MULTISPECIES: TIGR03752 family integrating conjugative element protein [Vibrio]|nr:TIGR03752 family integrating conjugative element protein [Vibrio splendidus]